MIININSDIAFSPSLFSIAVNAFKSGVKDISNQILMELVFVLKKQNDEVRNFYTELEQEPNLLNTIDLDKVYEFMDNNEIKIKRLLDLASEHKDKSDIFNECYKSLKELHTTFVMIPIEIGYLETRLMQEERLEHES